jgi:hypothetical protein
MKTLQRCFVLAALTGLLAVPFGCAEDNEKTAGITGKAPEGGGPKSQAELAGQMKGAGGGMAAQGYPAAKKTGR